MDNGGNGTLEGGLLLPTPRDIRANTAIGQLVLNGDGACGSAAALRLVATATDSFNMSEIGRTAVFALDDRQFARVEGLSRIPAPFRPVSTKNRVKCVKNASNVLTLRHA